MAAKNTPMTSSELAKAILEGSIAPAKAAKPSIRERAAIWTAELSASAEQFNAVRTLVAASAREAMAEDAARAVIAYRAAKGLPPL